MRVLADIAIGAAVIALPQGKLPLLALTVGIQTIKTVSSAHSYPASAHWLHDAAVAADPAPQAILSASAQLKMHFQQQPHT